MPYDEQLVISCSLEGPIYHKGINKTFYDYNKTPLANGFDEEYLNLSAKSVS